jgi:hypothetical protein
MSATRPSKKFCETCPARVESEWRQRGAILQLELLLD